MKNPLESEVSVYSNSEIAIDAKARPASRVENSERN
jgi:hypothetical protein